jgi:hypothetical protein
MRMKGRYGNQKSLKKGLYTKGGEFSDPQYLIANMYIGPYHTLNGIPFKGAEPMGNENYSPPVRLVPMTVNTDKHIYNDLKRIDFAKDFAGVTSTGPTITQKDEDRGWFFLYITQYLPSGEIMQIDKEQYDMIQKKKTPHHNLYEAAFMKWRIRGYLFDKIEKGVIQEYGVADTNRRSIAIVNDTIPGLSDYLTDLTAYSQPDDEENLWTEGTKLVDEFDKPYIGKYHVDTNFGPRSGAFPTSKNIFDLYVITDYIPPVAEEFRIKQTPQNAYNQITGGQ